MFLKTTKSWHSSLLLASFSLNLVWLLSYKEHIPDFSATSSSKSSSKLAPYIFFNFFLMSWTKLASLHRQKHFMSSSRRGLSVYFAFFRISSVVEPSHATPSIEIAPKINSFWVRVPVLSQKMWSISASYSGSCIDWTVHDTISPVSLSIVIILASYSIIFEYIILPVSLSRTTSRGKNRTSRSQNVRIRIIGRSSSHSIFSKMYVAESLFYLTNHQPIIPKITESKTTEMAYITYILFIVYSAFDFLYLSLP